MNIFDHYRQRYEAAKDEEFTLQEFLTICRQDRSAYANAAERLLMAIGEPNMVDTALEPRLSRLFSNRVVARYPAFEEFYGMEDAIEQIVSYLKHAAQGLEEKKQILYLLGPVGGGKSSLAERLKSLMQRVPIYVLSANGERSPVNDHPLCLFNPQEDAQILEKEGKLPAAVVACVGGGSNAIGAFTAFLNTSEVKLVGVEPAGHGLDTDKHSATLTLGKPGQIHGMACYVLEDKNGEPLPVHSIASGLDYPGVGPQHSYLKELGRVQYETATDQECLDAFMTLSRVEGIVPALESSHAVAWALREAPKMDKNIKIVVNLSGRGDKDADYVADKLGL